MFERRQRVHCKESDPKLFERRSEVNSTDSRIYILTDACDWLSGPYLTAQRDGFSFRSGRKRSCNRSSRFKSAESRPVDKRRADPAGDGPCPGAGQRANIRSRSRKEAVVGEGEQLTRVHNGATRTARNRNGASRWDRRVGRRKGAACAR